MDTGLDQIGGSGESKLRQLCLYQATPGRMGPSSCPLCRYEKWSNIGSLESPGPSVFLACFRLTLFPNEVLEKKCISAEKCRGYREGISSYYEVHTVEAFAEYVDSLYYHKLIYLLPDHLLKDHILEAARLVSKDLSMSMELVCLERIDWKDLFFKLAKFFPQFEKGELTKPVLDELLESCSPFEVAVISRLNQKSGTGSQLREWNHYIEKMASYLESKGFENEDTNLETLKEALEANPLVKVATLAQFLCNGSHISNSCVRSKTNPVLLDPYGLSRTTRRLIKSMDSVPSKRKWNKYKHKLSGLFS